VRRIVLTGGPGAEKTAVLDIVRRSICDHSVVRPEAAGIVFGGGFPHDDRVGSRRAAQRLIFHTERELEHIADLDHPAVELCDRGTVDGAAYWVGPGTLWRAMNTTRADELARYDTVIPRRFVVAATESFAVKAARTLEIPHAEMPRSCCITSRVS
jgi:AAA domain